MTATDEDYIGRPDEIVGGASLEILCKLIGDTLENKYPGWLWVIAPNHEGGIISIRSLRLSGEWGYLWRLADLSETASEVKRQVIMAAGEILERFGVPRGSYRYEDWAALPKLMRLPEPDLSDRPGWTQRKEREIRITQGLQRGDAVILRPAVTADPDGPRIVVPHE